jgi:hypothetical protein
MARYDIPDGAAQMLRSVGSLAREGFMPGEVLARSPEPSSVPPCVAADAAPPRAPMFHRLAAGWLAARVTGAPR